MKAFLRSTLNRMGFDVMRLRNRNDTLEAHLKNLFATRSIDCVLDVGANSGQYGAFLRTLGFSGHIVSFEPVKSVFEKLEANARNDSRWHCYNLALGDTAEKKEINVFSSTVFSSFLDANEYSKEIWNSLNTVAPETVAVARLDDMIDEIVARTGSTRMFLKMDTQGYDRKVFAGASEALVRVEALQSELALLAVYEGMPNPYEVLNDFHARGYFVSGMYPINRDESLAVIEYDCVLVKRLSDSRSAARS